MTLEAGKFKSMAPTSAQHLARAVLLHLSIMEDIMWRDRASVLTWVPHPLKEAINTIVRPYLHDLI